MLVLTSISSLMVALDVTVVSTRSCSPGPASRRRFRPPRTRSFSDGFAPAIAVSAVLSLAGAAAAIGLRERPREAAGELGAAAAVAALEMSARSD